LHVQEEGRFTVRLIICDKRWQTVECCIKELQNTCSTLLQIGVTFPYMVSVSLNFISLSNVLLES